MLKAPVRLPYESKDSTRQHFLGKSSHVLLPQGEGGLNQDSKALTEQIRAIDKQRLINRVGSVSNRFLRLIEQAILNSLDM